MASHASSGPAASSGQLRGSTQQEIAGLTGSSPSKGRLRFADEREAPAPTEKQLSFPASSGPPSRAQLQLLGGDEDPKEDSSLPFLTNKRPLETRPTLVDKGPFAAAPTLVPQGPGQRSGPTGPGVSAKTDAIPKTEGVDAVHEELVRIVGADDLPAYAKTGAFLRDFVDVMPKSVIECSGVPGYKGGIAFSVLEEMVRACRGKGDWDHKAAVSSPSGVFGKNSIFAKSSTENVFTEKEFEGGGTTTDILNVTGLRVDGDHGKPSVFGRAVSSAETDERQALRLRTSGKPSGFGRPSSDERTMRPENAMGNLKNAIVEQEKASSLPGGAVVEHPPPIDDLFPYPVSITHLRDGEIASVPRHQAAGRTPATMIPAMASRCGKILLVCREHLRDYLLYKKHNSAAVQLSYQTLQILSLKNNLNRPERATAKGLVLPPAGYSASSALHAIDPEIMDHAFFLISDWLRSVVDEEEDILGAVGSKRAKLAKWWGTRWPIVSTGGPGVDVGGAAAVEVGGGSYGGRDAEDASIGGVAAGGVGDKMSGTGDEMVVDSGEVSVEDVIVRGGVSAKTKAWILHNKWTEAVWCLKRCRCEGGNPLRGVLSHILCRRLIVCV